MTTTGKGYPIKQSAVQECLPATSVGLGALAMLSDATANQDRRFGLNIAKAEDERAALQTANTAVKASLAQTEMALVNEVNDEVLAGRVPNTSALPVKYVEAIKVSYSAVTDLLDRLQKGKSWEQQLNDCGLARAVHPIDGTEWVKEEYRVLYELKGRAIMGKSAAECCAIRISLENAVQRIQAGRRGALGRQWAARLRALKSRCDSQMCEALAAATEQARRNKEEGQRKILALEAELAQQEAASSSLVVCPGGGGRPLVWGAAYEP
uniref:Uncharacterized protein n=1 Tax=Calcidiscus leptoporus TaxID=127549 RepID=A0A7S0J5I0_9EUKA|mmetsp:Transcript_40191/g.93812  ORF Transcript_40191/g.93812 Transcript_40191/m.93812 type:complete len:267 (+) Transcript_40191:397-1197(+)